MALTWMATPRVRTIDIDAKKLRLDSMRPLPTYTAKSLREKLALEWTYNCNAIEGNALTLIESKVALEGVVLGHRLLREQIEVKNHHTAIRYVEAIASNGVAFSTSHIQYIHHLLRSGVNREAGRYRRENVVVTGVSTTPPDFLHLPQEMASMVEWYEAASELNPISRAAELHTRFVKIHPFVDGNGRTGRLLLNFELMKSGYPPAIIRKEDRLDYYNVLDEACVTGDYTGITQLVAESTERSVDLYLSLLGDRPQSMACGN